MHLLPPNVKCALVQAGSEDQVETPPTKKRAEDVVEFSFGNVTNCGQLTRSTPFSWLKRILPRQTTTKLHSGSLPGAGRSLVKQLWRARVAHTVEQ